MVPVTSADFYQCMTKNEVRTVAWATCQINTVIHRCSNESADLEGSFSLYIHLVVYTNMICLRGRPFKSQRYPLHFFHKSVYTSL